MVHINKMISIYFKNNFCLFVLLYGHFLSYPTISHLSVKNKRAKLVPTVSIKIVLAMKSLNFCCTLYVSNFWLNEDFKLNKFSWAKEV